MSDNKARRVKGTSEDTPIRGNVSYGLSDQKCMFYSDLNGTHMLVPVEVWERVKTYVNRAYDCRAEKGVKYWVMEARNALAEIGGEDG